MYKLRKRHTFKSSQIKWLLSEPCRSQWATPRRTDGSPRRNAFWASWVMASASSRITNLKPFLENKTVQKPDGRVPFKSVYNQKKKKKLNNLFFKLT